MESPGSEGVAGEWLCARLIGFQTSSIIYVSQVDILFSYADGGGNRGEWGMGREMSTEGNEENEGLTTDFSDDTDEGVGGSGGGASGERQGGTRWTAWTGKESC